MKRNSFIILLCFAFILNAYSQDEYIWEEVHGVYEGEIPLIPIEEVAVEGELILVEESPEIEECYWEMPEEVIVEETEVTYPTTEEHCNNEAPSEEAATFFIKTNKRIIVFEEKQLVKKIEGKEIIVRTEKNRLKKDITEEKPWLKRVYTL